MSLHNLLDILIFFHSSEDISATNLTYAVLALKIDDIFSDKKIQIQIKKS